MSNQDWKTILEAIREVVRCHAHKGETRKDVLTAFVEHLAVLEDVSPEGTEWLAGELESIN